MFAINGIGTMLIGKAKKRDEPREPGPAFVEQAYGSKSYQAVKWFTFFFVPVVPLGTYRVRTADEKLFGVGTSYHLMQRIDWDWKQVMSHYAAGWLPILLIIGILAWADAK